MKALYTGVEGCGLPSRLARPRQAWRRMEVYRDVFDSFFELVQAPRDDEDVGTFRGKEACDASTHTLGATSDKDGLFVQG